MRSSSSPVSRKVAAVDWDSKSPVALTDNVDLNFNILRQELTEIFNLNPKLVQTALRVTWTHFHAYLCHVHREDEIPELFPKPDFLEAYDFSKTVSELSQRGVEPCLPSDPILQESLVGTFCKIARVLQKHFNGIGLYFQTLVPVNSTSKTNFRETTRTTFRSFAHVVASNLTCFPTSFASFVFMRSQLSIKDSSSTGISEQASHQNQVATPLEFLLSEKLSAPLFESNSLKLMHDYSYFFNSLAPLVEGSPDIDYSKFGKDLFGDRLVGNGVCAAVLCHLIFSGKGTLAFDALLKDDKILKNHKLFRSILDSIGTLGLHYSPKRVHLVLDFLHGFSCSITPMTQNAHPNIIKQVHGCIRGFYKRTAKMEGLSPEALGSMYRSPALFMAAALDTRSSLEDFKLLFPANFNWQVLMECRDVDGGLFIHHAARLDRSRLIEFLYEKCSEMIGLERTDGFTALGIAGLHGKLPAIQTLLDCGARLDQKNGNVGTVFHCLLVNGKNGGHPYVFDDFLNFLLSDQTTFSRDDILEFLKIQNSQGLLASHLSAKGSLLVPLQCLFKQFPELLEANDSKSGTILHWAAEFGNRTVAMHYSEQIKLHTCNNDDMTPFSVAVLAFHLGTAEALYRSGFLRGLFNIPIIYHYILKGDVSALRRLRALISHCRTQDLEQNLESDGNALNSEKLENMVKGTLRSLVNKTDKDDSPLSLVAKQGDRDHFISILKEWGAGVTFSTSRPNLAEVLHIAISHKYVSTFEKLLIHFPEMVDSKEKVCAVIRSIFSSSRKHSMNSLSDLFQAPPKDESKETEFRFLNALFQHCDIDVLRAVDPNSIPRIDCISEISTRLSEFLN